RVGEHGEHAGLLLLEENRRAGERAAGAGAGYERIDPPVRVAPDLRPGRLDVRLAVGAIVELVRPDRAVGFRREPARELLEVVRILVRHRGHRPHLGAERAQQVELLGRLRLGDHDHAAVAACVAHVREADAGVAGRALDDRAARAERAASLRGEHDELRGPVLDRAARVQELRLAEDLAAGFLARAVETDERGIADGVDEIAVVLQDAGRLALTSAAPRSGYRASETSSLPGTSASRRRSTRTAK